MIIFSLKYLIYINFNKNKYIQIKIIFNRFCIIIKYISKNNKL